MNGDDYKLMVTNVAEENQIDQLGKAVPLIRVTYTVGSHGPFTERFPKEGYTGAAAKLKLQQMAAQIQATANY